jgi:hypothetical protein
MAMSSPESLIPSGVQRSRGPRAADAVSETGLSFPGRDLSAPTAGSLDSTRNNEFSREVFANPQQIELHVEELVLHGFETGDRYGIAEAVEHELARLLGQRGVPFSLRSENATDELKAPTFAPALGAKPPAIGRQIAQAVYEGFSQ